MMPELWATLSLVLLAGAAVARCLVLSRAPGPWVLMAALARLAACLLLVLALLPFTGEGGTGSIASPRLALLGLALVTLVVYLLFVWRLGMDAAAPIADLVVMALVVTASLASKPLQLGPTRLQTGVPLLALWILLLVGTGAGMVAGSTGLMLALRAVLRPRTPSLSWPRWLDLHLLLKQATFLALVALGAALVVSVWWAWQIGGMISIGDAAPAFGGSDDGLVWFAITWLVAAMSQLARRAGKWWGRWEAGLAVSTAVTGLVGFLMLVAPASLL